MSRVRVALLAALVVVLGVTSVIAFTEPAAAAAPAPPPASRSHYLRALSNTLGGNASAMSALGCSDGQSGSREVVLDIGAQTVHAPLSAANPGVALSATDPVIRVSYPNLVSAIQSYADGFHGCAAARTVTLVVATNSDGEFVSYTATTKGKDWADRVIDPLRAYVASKSYGRIAVLGGNDIEAGFAATITQAGQWEDAFLANTAANLQFIGSADGCPTTAGVVNGTCNRGWTQLQYSNLTTKLGRVFTLPQIYVTAQATQWRNIDATGGKKIVFMGSLSEHAACPTAGSGCPTASLTPAQAWTALWNALQPIGVTPQPIATDLDVVD
ncbi:MAG TPA: hypothetical protein VJ831_13660 [Jatrophihabitantaceae bacterium]|nr:hypothetical protein [Jatrophihabitantaceae bacterium]